jgi:hypothetical protein
MVRIVFFSWAFIWCALDGPGVLSSWDLTGDGAFDLADVAEMQNGMVEDVDGTVGYERCCCNGECSARLCDELFGGGEGEQNP